MTLSDPRPDLGRRSFLRTSIALGCSAAASPFVTPVVLADTPGDHRLVVIVLRGAMDGLDAIRPLGDRELARHRPNILAKAEGGQALTDLFVAHPALAPLMPLWAAGELSMAHAVSTPYRDKRSHFDGQDLLENGGNDSGGIMTSSRDGWLNRMLSLLPDATARTAFAVGHEDLLLLKGAEKHSSWSPDSELDMTPQARLLLDAVWRTDPLFAKAGGVAMELAEETGDAMSTRDARRARALAEYAASQLAGSARVAAFSINGWDTHYNQWRGIEKALGELSEAILALKAGLGRDWDKTAVLCLTEFGRTVRENGNQGTDHGTGGAAIFAGGALKGKSVYTDWPGLASRDLYQDRDLMPTRDVRAFAAWAMRDMFGLGASQIERVVFPGLEMGRDPRLIA